MKTVKNRIFLSALSVLFLVGCQKESKQESYVAESHQDKNGYTYESVTNDPTGLRLYTLDNGLKVYLSQNNDAPTIQTYVAVRAGSSYDPKESTGLAHYLEHMLFKGTDKYATNNWEAEEGYISQISDLYEQHRAEEDPDLKEGIYRKIDSVSYIASGYAIANEYEKMVSSLGATGTNAHTSNEETVYHNKIPANELDKFLELESEKFRKLVLRLFHTELEAVYEEFNRGLDNDPAKTFYALMDGLYPTHPYGQQTTIGTSNHLKNPSMLHIQNYFNKYYVPSNMALVLVGDLDYEETIKKVDGTFGKLEGKEVEHPVLPKEEPATEIVVREVYGPTSENISFGWRTKGLLSEDAKYIALIERILSNNSAGLIDLNLNQKKLIQSCLTWTYMLNDYGLIAFDAWPKEGQTLDELKDLIIEQVNIIKKGEFEDWMLEAVINDLKLSKIKEYENPTALAASYYSAFIHRKNWDDQVRFLDDLSAISKDELVAYANELFKDNYTIVYKREGVDENIAKVKNPNITPIQINREEQSEFLQNFIAKESEELKPVFVDFKEAIKRENLDSGIEITHIKNKNNDLFNLNIIFDMGKDNDKKLTLAVGYLESLGTDKYTAEALAKEFFKLGIRYSVNTGSDRSYVSLSGLEENLDKGLLLLEHLMSNAVVDQEAYDKYVSSILKARSDGKTEKDNILWNGLGSYAQYGENSRLRNIFTVDQLTTMDPSELVGIIKDLNNYKHRVFYYGKHLDKAKSALNEHHKVPNELKEYPPAIEYEQLATGKNVYFVDFDMVQSEMLFIARGDEFDPKKMAMSNVFNSYFGTGMSSIIWQEIRESKSLAYAAQASYQTASEKGKHDLIWTYIGTQANKIPEAVDAMLELMNDMPEAEAQFEAAKEAALKKISAQRITKSNIFWTYESLLKRGIDYDIREDMYQQIQQMGMKDVSSFFDSNVKGIDYSVSVIGNKKDLDLEALKKLGKVHEMDVDYLFNYKETAVKQ
ncbi:M16 family metallopeptidase [Lutimonas vermicola]|uniref:Insulinase family protein n=1 Tax=Lutimonas vermicola TaxID=414288 RepID=A0ABU9KX57_9FLAO